MQRFSQTQIKPLINELFSKTILFEHYEINTYTNPYIRIKLSDIEEIQCTIYSSVEKYPRLLVLEILTYTPPKREEWEKENNNYPDEDFQGNMVRIAKHSFNLTNSAIKLQYDIEVPENFKFKKEYFEFLNIVRNFLKK